MHKILTTAFLLAALAACSSDDPAPTDTGASIGTTTEGAQDPDTTGEQGGANTDGDSTARYRLTFSATWSEETHPLNFPAGPHFSGLVGAVHNAQVILWERGGIATDGIELMAETGAKAGLLAEVQSAIDSGYAVSEISGSGVALSPGSTSVEFSVSVDNSLVSVVSMLAPSPDWFVGVNSLGLYRDGAFIEQETVDLRLYDAGTDSGLQYASGNLDTSPQDTITRLSADSLDAPFVEGLPAIGQFLFERLP